MRALRRTRSVRSALRRGGALRVSALGGGARPSVDGVHRDMIASRRALCAGDADAVATLQRPDSTAPVHVCFDWRAEEERGAFRERHLSTRSRAKTGMPTPGVLLFSEGTPRLYAPHHLQKGRMYLTHPEDENSKKSSN